MASMTDQAGVRLGIAGGALFVATAVVVGVPVPQGYAAAALLVLTTACCLALPVGAALFLAVAGWALSTGFVANNLGELTFGPHDLLRLATYLAVAALVARARLAPQ
jgi:hypothetical protein